MKENNSKLIQKELYLKLDKKRYKHTMGVAYTAAALAMCYGFSVEKAQMAGLLHDCAKCYSASKLLEKCDKFNITVTDTERGNPYLLHAKLGAFLAMHKYGVKDTEIISAILHHTTGKPDMSLLDKIIFVADYIEPGRSKAPRLAQIRQMAFSDLDRAVIMILADTLEYLRQEEQVIDSMTEKTYEYYLEAMKEQQEGGIA